MSDLFYYIHYKTVIKPSKAFSLTQAFFFSFVAHENVAHLCRTVLETKRNNKVLCRCCCPKRDLLVDVRIAFRRCKKDTILQVVCAEYKCIVHSRSTFPPLYLCGFIRCHGPTRHLHSNDYSNFIGLGNDLWQKVNQLHNEPADVCHSVSRVLRIRAGWTRPVIKKVKKKMGVHCSSSIQTLAIAMSREWARGEHLAEEWSPNSPGCRSSKACFLSSWEARPTLPFPWSVLSERNGSRWAGEELKEGNKQTVDRPSLMRAIKTLSTCKCRLTLESLWSQTFEISQDLQAHVHAVTQQNVILRTRGFFSSGN